MAEHHRTATKKLINGHCLSVFTKTGPQSVIRCSSQSDLLTETNTAPLSLLAQVRKRVTFSIEKIVA